MLFQHDEPLIHKVYREQHQLVRTFFSFFVKPDVLSAVKRDKDLLQLNFKEENLICKELIYIGSGATCILKKKTNSLVVQNVLKVIHEACLKSGKYILKKLPLNNEVLQTFSCIDPAMVTSPSTAILKIYLSHQTLVHNVISNEQNDEYEKNVWMLLSNGQLPSHMQANGDEVHFLQWWLKIHEQYHLLFKMVTSILSNFNAPKVDRSFSIMGDVVDKKCGRMKWRCIPVFKQQYPLEANCSAKQVRLHNSFLKFNLYTSQVTS